MGRGWQQEGGHTKGYNNRAVAFSLIGNYEEQPVPDNMLHTVQQLAQCGISQVRIIFVKLRKNISMLRIVEVNPIFKDKNKQKKTFILNC